MGNCVVLGVFAARKTGISLLLIAATTVYKFSTVKGILFTSSDLLVLATVNLTGLLA